MALKTTVAVGNITNLSEARYCAGMGVQYLCFPAHRVDPKVFKEITGWVSGPTFIVDLSEAEHPSEAMTNYATNHWLMRPEHLTRASFPFGQTIFLDVRSSLSPPEIEIAHAFFLVIREEQLPVFSRQAGEKLLVAGDTKSLISKIERGAVHGIWLEGSDEQRPGLKDYAALGEVLEQLDLQ